MVIVRGGARRVFALVIVEDISAVMLEDVIMGVAVCVILREAERVSSVRGRGRKSERRERVRQRGVKGRGREACKGEAERHA